MAWSTSEVFRAFFGNAMDRTAAFDLNTDTFKVALYNGTITPDQNAAAASTAYNTGQWAVANEVSHVGQWAVAGVALNAPFIDIGTAGVVFWDNTGDTASGSAATLASVFGCLVYDDTLTTPVADQGVCYNYFGGSNSVTNGTLTVVWHANGIWRATL